MHITLVTTSYPDSQSGSEAAGGFVADFAQELAKHVRVSVVAATASESSVRDEGGVRVYRFSVRRWPLSLLRPYNPTDWWAILATLTDGRKTLQGVVENDRPDYVLALWALPSGYWARNAQKRHGIPYGVWALGSDIWGLGRIPILRSYLRSTLIDADRCFADGLKLAEDVTAISGKPCDFLPSSRLLANGDSRLVSDAPPYRLAYLGRWHPNKGVDVLMDALALLADDDWAKLAEVRIHGGGPLGPKVHETADELRALGRPVEVGGYLDKRRAAELIAWADYIAIPSRIESIPVIFSDAAQMRRPMIATPVGDLPSLFKANEFGALATDSTAEAYANAIRSALRVSPTRFEPGLEATMAEFDLTSSARKVIGLIKDRDY